MDSGRKKISRRGEQAKNPMKKCDRGTYPGGQWLRLHAPKAEGMGSIPGQITKIPCAVWSNLKKRKEKKVMWP